MRTINGNKIGVGLCLCAAALTMGCSEGTDFGRLAGGESGIGFEVSLAGEGEGVATRSTIGTKSFEGGASEGKTFRLRTGVTENRENPFASTAKSRATEITTDNLFDSFGVYAYAYDSSKKWEDISTTGSSSYSLYIANDMVTLSGNYGGFTPARYWPSAYKLTFFAYAPTELEESSGGSGDGTLAVNLNGSDNLPQISYTVPAGWANQKDLVVATATDQTESANSGSVPLTFEHILTAVQVKCGTFSEGTISNITLSGIKGAGTYDMATGVWSLDENTTATYAVTGEFAAKDDAPLLTEGYTLMLLPQKLGEDATITLTYIPDGGTADDAMTLTAGLCQEDLKDDEQEWEMGKKVTYIISWEEEDPYNGHEAVDLGVSVLWATCNVGAESPADFGEYFAFGEIAPKDEYTTDNSIWYGVEVTEDEIMGNLKYDAATANWGGGWRTPTEDELNELKDLQRDWDGRDQSAGYTYGVEVHGTGTGEGNSIFLPAGGFIQETLLSYQGSYGYYRSCTPNLSNTNRSTSLRFYHASQISFIIDSFDRYTGFAVRPVIDKVYQE